MVYYITKQPIIGVTAVVGKFGGQDTQVEDGGTVILELANGMLVTLVGGYWMPKRSGEGSWTIRGTERWVAWNGNELKIQGQNPQWVDAVHRLYFSLVTDSVLLVIQVGRPCDQ